MHPVSYSAVSPYLMAFLGVRPTMVVAGTLTAGLLALLLERSRLRHAGRCCPPWSARVALTGNAVSGRVTFGLGMLFGVATLLAVFAWSVDSRTRPWLFRLRVAVIVLLTAVTTAASAVAGLFLGLVAAALWLTGRHRIAYAVGVPPVAVVAVSAWLFPLSGVQPMAWNSAILPTVAGADRRAALPARVAAAAGARVDLPRRGAARLAGALARRHQHRAARPDLHRRRPGAWSSSSAELRTGGPRWPPAASAPASRSA